jgi:hypothetical protein
VRRAGTRPSCEVLRDGGEPLVATLDGHVVGCEGGPDTCRARGPMPSLAGTGPCPPSSMQCQYDRSTRGSVPAAGQPEEKRGP